MTDDIGEHLQKVGCEFGTVTGRSRRCGWIDMVMLKYAIRLSGITGLALMKLDVLDDMETVKICTHYEAEGKRIDAFPTSLKQLAKCQPVYEELPGWQCSTQQARTFDELPINAQNYIKRLEDLTGVTIKIIAIGPKREETIIKEDLF